MTRLNEKYNWGNTLSEENPDLYRQLNDVYSDLASKSNGKSNKINMTMPPPANSPVNKNFDIGDIWVQTNANTAWVMTSRTTSETVMWRQIT